MPRETVVGIEGDSFLINGRATYEGRTYDGMRVDGLLMNARLVQGVFDDRNGETRGMWDYPDGPWDPQRNVEGFVEAMGAWRAKGLVSFTINFQGGSPKGYSRHQPWYNSAFEVDGELRDDYRRRMKLVLDRADELGMAPIVGVFYFGQEYRLTDEQSVVRALDGAIDWLTGEGYANVLIEIANEVDVPRYRHEIVRPHRVDELIRRVQERSSGKVASPAGRLLVGTSMGGGAIPPDNVVAASDFLLLHGNGVGQPDRIRGMVDRCRQSPGYSGRPILFNEDDHFDFAASDNNMLAAVSRRAGWGYFDYRMEGEGFDEGFQSVPVNWRISSDRKRGFFDLLAKVTGAAK
ncbi:MAG: hypothetical protein WBF17_28210 [Phycisphaerae bacterium]